MFKAIHVFPLFLLLAETVAASQIIATVGYNTGGGFTSNQACTSFTSTIAHAGVHPLGDVLLSPWPAPFLWENGFSGTFDMTTTLDFAPFFNFSRMVESITDGLDEPMFLDGTVEGCNQLLPHSPFIMESTVFQTPSDLIGNNIDFIRVLVNNLQIEQLGTTTNFDLSISYQFWGTPIPEPAALMPLALAGLCAKSRTRRARIIH